MKKDNDIQKLEEILKLMQQYRVRSVKIDDILIDGLELPAIPEEPIKEDNRDEEEDLLFYSAD